MTIQIGNAQAFWGDSPNAAERLIKQAPRLDFLTLDYLSEVSLSIMAIQKEQDPEAGFAKDFVEVVESLIDSWEKGAKVKVVTNAGGLNPIACARACMTILKKKCRQRTYRIAVIAGDDVLSHLKNASPSDFRNLDDGESIQKVQDRLVTANAYLGAMEITDALRSGADIVITGRVADPSLTVGPCVYHFDWLWEDYDRLAGATLAGHLIECGTQVTGGISTDWLQLENPIEIGFPIAEIDSEGRCVITKAAGTGGQVSLQTVKEQLVYEVGDPGNYLSPDVRASFLGVKVEEIGKDHVRVQGARGEAPPYTLKVSATYRAGFKAEGYLTLFGTQAALKARRCADVIRAKLASRGFYPQRFLAECLGTGACAPGTVPKMDELLHECTLRIAVQDENKAIVEQFSKELASLVTCGPPGLSGYTSGRPHVRPVFGYWPCLIDAQYLRPEITYIEVPRCP